MRSIQAAIRPLPHPPPPPNPNPSNNVRIAKSFGTSAKLNEEAARQHWVLAEKVATDWTRLAYVQLLRRHADVCNAIMLFAELERQDSNAWRILLFPRSWEEVSTRHQQSTTSTQTSLRLLRKAAERYQVELLAIEPILNTSEGSC